MTVNYKKLIPDAAMVALFLLLSLAYFFTPMSEGLVLGGHDAVASVGQGHEQLEYKALTGETTRWTNSLFSGMPTYQIAPSYRSAETLTFLSRIYALGTTGAFGYLFLFLLGCYILLRAFGLRPGLSAVGAAAWALSSYFPIIMAAGHIWKVMTLVFIPPTIGGMVLAYRGKYLAGGAVTALFTAFQILSNHIQMSYYFFALMLFLALAYGIDAFRRRALPQWAKATAVVVVSGLLGVAANLPNLYHTYAYSKESMRGPSELTPLPQETANDTGSGLSRDYITQWSYGIDETLTLLIPDFKGGGSGAVLNRPDVQQLEGVDQFYQYATQAQQELAKAGDQLPLPGLNQYWGEQPFTVGPVYAGALICFLFVLGLFLVRGPVKWALLAGTLLSCLIAWGHNDPWFTNFCIDHLPLYNKFRTPSSALVVAELTLPLLGVLALREVLNGPRALLCTRRGRLGLVAASALTVGLCLVLWIAPSAAGSCLSGAERESLGYLGQTAGPQFAAGYANAVSQMRYAILSASALRSAFFILAGLAAILLYARHNRRREKPQHALWLVAIVAALCVADLWTVDKRYLSDAQFTDPVQLQTVDATPADLQVLQDTSDYRVLDLSQGNPFNETSNHSAYFHQSVGGYNAAKLHRYQDLIDRRLNGELSAIAAVLYSPEADSTQLAGTLEQCSAFNMLNAKYIIYGTDARQVMKNPAANGNGWFVRNLTFVPTPDAEMVALQDLDTKHSAVADERFRQVLDGTPLDSGTVSLTLRQPNALNYTVSSPKGGVAVLSEVYYPGWTATLDGEPAELARANYLLRAVRIPAGTHQLELTYKPATVGRTEAVAYAAIGIILLTLVVAVVVAFRPKRTGAKA